MTRFRRIRWCLRGMTLLILAIACWLGQRWWSGNTGSVVPSRVYRASQLDAGQLTALIRLHRIKTVINLRGANPDAGWYRAERNATLRAGCTQVDVSLASDLWLSRAQSRALLDLLDSVAYPALIHCQWGAERTGLLASFVQLLRPGGTLADARREFSLHYLFVPTPDGRVMTGHLDAYERWLAARGLDHDPQRFRHWLLDEYQPGEPSREYWPYDPYPLVIVTAPPIAASAPVASRDRTATPR